MQVNISNAELLTHLTFLNMYIHAIPLHANNVSIVSRAISKIKYTLVLIVDVRTLFLSGFT